MKKTLPYIERLTDAVEYVYLLREWLGNSVDVTFWWKTRSNKCYYFHSVTGEVQEEKALPRIIRDTEIDAERFNLMVQHLVVAGILEFQTDMDHGIMANFSDFYMISLENGSSNSFWAMSGHHRDPRFSRIVDIIVDNMKGRGRFIEQNKPKKRKRGKD